MKKQTQQILFGLGALLAFGGVIYFYRKSMGVNESKKSDEEEGLKEPEKKVIEVSETQSMTSGNFKEKVKTLQALLGFTGDDVDGFAGDDTKTALDDKGFGRSITTANINSLISKLQKTASDANLTKARKVRATALARVAATKKQYTWTDKDAKLPIYVKDALGVFNKTSNVLVVNKNDKFKIPIQGQTILSSGFIRARISDKDGRERYIIVSPYSVTVF
jgi:hypothetical protein